METVVNRQKEASSTLSSIVVVKYCSFYQCRAVSVCMNTSISESTRARTIKFAGNMSVAHR